MAINFTIPANVQPEIREAFRQLEEHIRRLDVPVLRDMREVRGIDEGTSCYHYSVSGGVRRFTKINGKLYSETLSSA